MRYVTPKDIEKINEVAHEMEGTWAFSFNKVANKTGWSVTTVRKYYDKDWYPGKYYQKPVKSKKYTNNLNYSGLYLLIQRIIDNYDNIINLVKVGQAHDLKQRLDSYKGSNPFATCIDVLPCHKDDLNELEKAYHMLLGTKNKRYGKTEWFICDDEQFEWWKEHKLDAFRSNK